MHGFNNQSYMIKKLWKKIQKRAKQQIY